MNDYPLTRHDPGTLPEPPDQFSVTAAKWFYKIAAWAKVRTALDVKVYDIEDVAELMQRYEETEPPDKDIALLNANLKLAEAGFSETDLKHLDIPIHEMFSKHKQKMKQHLAKPEN